MKKRPEKQLLGRYFYGITHTFSMKKQLFQGLFCVFCALFYLAVEYFVIAATPDILRGYLFHTVSEFGVPIGKIYAGEIARFSPRFLLMNADLVFAGATFPFAYTFITRGKNRLIPLAVFVGICIGLIGVFHQGEGITAKIHLCVATGTFVGGNALLILTGLDSESPFMRQFSLILGGVGLVEGALMGLCALSPFEASKAVFERLCIYPLVIWELTGGILLTFKNGYATMAKVRFKE